MKGRTMGKLSRSKGHRFERAMVKWFRDHLPGWIIPDRGMQSRGGKECPDVSLTSPATDPWENERGVRQLYHVECLVQIKILVHYTDHFWIAMLYS